MSFNYSCGAIKGAHNGSSNWSGNGGGLVLRNWQEVELEWTLKDQGHKDGIMSVHTLYYGSGLWAKSVKLDETEMKSVNMKGNLKPVHWSVSASLLWPSVNIQSDWSSHKCPAKGTRLNTPT